VAGGTLFNGLAGNSVDDPVNRGYRTDGLAPFAEVPTDQRVDRATASFTATWRATGWLSAHAIVGGEAVHRDDARSIPLAPEASLPTAMRVEGSSGRDRSATLGANATASFNLAKSLNTPKRRSASSGWARPGVRPIPPL
jgi:hypothetical protein